MIASNLNNKLSTKYCEHDIKCGNTGTNHCQGCGQLYCVDHYLEHHSNIQEHLEYVINIHRLLEENLKSLTSPLPMEQIHELKMKSIEIEKTINIMQERLQDLIVKGQQNLKKPSIKMTYDGESDRNDYLENDIEQVRTDIEELGAKLQEINSDDQVKPSPDEEETIQKIEVIGSNTTSRITRKIRLSHNYVQWIRGPAKKMVNGVTHVADVYTQRKDIDDTVVQAVKQGLIQQKLNPSTQSVFAEMTSNWKFEGENADRGFISASIWMRDPQGRRILVKTQGHPLSAVNEWLAYILGETLGLPVNEVQIAIYQNKLVTLHTDIAHENEKTVTFMELPKLTRKILLTYPIMGSMDLFDHIIQNVDRTPRNILITMPDTTARASDPAYLKIHLIDHSFSFGVGKREVISAIACKLHSKHLSVVKFDPIDIGRKFEQYLSKLPIPDRIVIRKTLTNFAAITDDQLDSWMTKVQDLLSTSQYKRIYDALSRQRDIAKYYAVQWGIGIISSSMKPYETN